MNTHHFQLATVPFEAIISGAKTIESRLYDEKRQQINLGDAIVFTNREDATRTVSVRVVGLLRYATFHELFTYNDPSKFGGENVEWLENQIGDFYTPEQQRKNGVLGIEFVLL